MFHILDYSFIFLRFILFYIKQVTFKMKQIPDGRSDSNNIQIET